MDDFKRTDKTLIAVAFGIPMYQGAYLHGRSRRRASSMQDFLCLESVPHEKIWRYAQNKWLAAKNTQHVTFYVDASVNNHVLISNISSKIGLLASDTECVCHFNLICIVVSTNIKEVKSCCQLLMSPS